MTWHTQAGDRYLIGAEARLFRAGLRSTVEELEDDWLDCSHTMLARQTRKARLHLFAYVGKHLLRQTDDMPPLNAWTEGAVGIVFRRLNAEVEIELDLQDQRDDPYFWRTLVADATTKDDKECVQDEPFDHTCNDDSVWRTLLEILHDRILWDLDWEVEDDVTSEPVKQMLGIDASYFEWNQVPFASNKEAVELLGKLCGFRRGESEGETIFEP